MWNFLILASTTLLMLTSVHHGYAEVYTALADMEELLETERVLIQSLSTFIRAQDQMLNQLKRYIFYICTHVKFLDN